jgi:hypothetical protein
MVKLFYISTFPDWQIDALKVSNFLLRQTTSTRDKTVCQLFGVAKL